MEKASADYTRATSNSWLAKHWKLNATPSSGYATRKRSMTKSFVASSTTSILLKLACIDEDNSSHVSARQTTEIQMPTSRSRLSCKLSQMLNVLSSRVALIPFIHVESPTSYL